MIRRWFKINTSDIAIIQFIIEGYEGSATVSTIDPEAAVIQVLIMTDFTADMDGVLNALKEQFTMKEILPGYNQARIC